MNRYPDPEVQATNERSRVRRIGGVAINLAVTSMIAVGVSGIEMPFLEHIRHEARQHQPDDTRRSHLEAPVLPAVAVTPHVPVFSEAK